MTRITTPEGTAEFWKQRVESAERDQHLLRRTVADQRDRIRYLEGKGGVTWERAQAALQERDEAEAILVAVRRLCEDDPSHLSAEIRGLLDGYSHGAAR